MKTNHVSPSDSENKFESVKEVVGNFFGINSMKAKFWGQQPQPGPNNPTEPAIEVPDPSKQKEVPEPPQKPEIEQMPPKPEEKSNSEDVYKKYESIYGKQKPACSYPESVVFQRNSEKNFLQKIRCN